MARKTSIRKLMKTIKNDIQIQFHYNHVTVHWTYNYLIFVQWFCNGCDKVRTFYISKYFVRWVRLHVNSYSVMMIKTDKQLARSSRAPLLVKKRLASHFLLSLKKSITQTGKRLVQHRVDKGWRRKYRLVTKNEWSCVSKRAYVWSDNAVKVTTRFSYSFIAFMYWSPKKLLVLYGARRKLWLLPQVQIFCKKDHIFFYLSIRFYLLLLLKITLRECNIV